MSSQDPAPGQTPEGQKEKEVQADSPRGRTKVADHPSPSQQARHGRADSRSVSRGRTHAKHPHKHGHGKVDPSTEAFVYPGLAGGFAPKGRPPTMFEASYLSDAPHLEYKTPTNKKSRASGGVKSPQMSHIRMEVEAAAEMAGARGEAAGVGKAPEESLEKD